MEWTVRGLIKTTTDYFREKGVGEPRLTTELLLAETLNKERVSLYLNFDKPISEEELSIFRNFVKRRLANEPVQYITGKTGFMGFELETREGVFIPRQETEILVSAVKRWVDKNRYGNFVLYDIGTGTGAIALFFAKHYKNAKLYASDVSKTAIECAKFNSDNHNVFEKIIFLCGNLFEPFQDVEKADVIISNPPYIPMEEINNLSKIVKKEPVEALDGGKEGLYFIAKIIKDAKGYLKPKGLLALEIGVNQSEPVKELFSSEDAYEFVGIIPDLRGIKRVVTAEKI